MSKTMTGTAGDQMKRRSRKITSHPRSPQLAHRSRPRSDRDLKAKVAEIIEDTTGDLTGFSSNGEPMSPEWIAGISSPAVRGAVELIAERLARGIDADDLDDLSWTIEIHATALEELQDRLYDLAREVEGAEKERR